MSSDREARLEALLGAVAAAPPIEIGRDDGATLDPGAVLAERFVVEGVLGRGGMGVVYRGADLRLARPVALKLIAQRTDLRALEGFRREAQVMAQLAAPNIVEVFDIGTHDGAPFIAMELLGGHSLRHWQAGRSCAEIIAAYGQVARGLAAAHARGIVHRDVKPDNVFVGEDGTVKVGDFGLARLRRPDSEETGSGSSGSADRTGAVGTRGYVSPEQQAGDALDARSDQFSFCVSLWEALTGVPPFPAGSGRSQAIIARELEGSGQARRRIPWRLRRAIRRGLHPDPRRRHPSMETLLDALEAPRSRAVVAGGFAAALLAGAWFLAGRPEPAPPCERLDAAHESVSGLVQEQAWIAGVGPGARDPATRRASAVAALARSRLARWSANEAQICAATPPDPDALECLRYELGRLRGALSRIGDDPRELLRAGDVVARQIPQPRECGPRGIGSLSGGSPMQGGAALRDRLEAIERHESAPGSPARIELAQQIETDARARASASDHARALLALATEKAAAWAFDDAAAFAEEAYNTAHTGRDDALAIEALNVLVPASREANLPGRHRWLRGLELAAESGELPRLARARCLATLGGEQLAAGEHAEAAARFQEAQQTYASLEEPSEANALRLQRARALLLQGEYAEALEHVTAGVAYLEQDPLTTPSERAAGLSLKAGALVMTGAYADALENAQAARDGFAQARDSPRHAESQGLLAFVLIRLERPAEALALVRDAELQLEARVGRSNRRFAKLLGLESTALAAMGQLEASIRASEEAVVIKEQIGDRSLAHSINNLAATHYDLGNTDRAIPLVRRAIAVEADAHKSGSIDTARFRLSLATYLNATRRDDEALAELEQVIAVFTATEGLDPEELLAANLLRANIDYGRGDFRRAQSGYESIFADPGFDRLAAGNKGSAALMLLSSVWRQEGPAAARALGKTLIDGCPADAQPCEIVAKIVAGERGIQHDPRFDPEQGPAETPDP